MSDRRLADALNASRRVIDRRAVAHLAGLLEDAAEAATDQRTAIAIVQIHYELIVMSGPIAGLVSLRCTVNGPDGERCPEHLHHLEHWTAPE